MIIFVSCDQQNQSITHHTFTDRVIYAIIRSAFVHKINVNSHPQAPFPEIKIKIITSNLYIHTSHIYLPSIGSKTGAQISGEHIDSPDKHKNMDRRSGKSINIGITVKIENVRNKKSFDKNEKRLIKYDDLPEYLQDNEFILDYYRCEWPLKDLVSSTFAWHNETLNIWTHLIGFMVFLTLTVLSVTEKVNVESLIGIIFRWVDEGALTMILSKPNTDASSSGLYARHLLESLMLKLSTSADNAAAIPRWPWYVFLGGAMGCLLCSSLSHLFACHSHRLNLFFWRLDYAGISLMIVCSFFAPIYYAFPCNPYSRIFYLTFITLLGIIAITTLLSPALSAPRYRSFRASLFFCMGFSGVIPAAHAIVLNWGHPQITTTLVYEIVMGLLYATGVVFYVRRIPERWKPGAFDIAGHSHQIFHAFVVAGALAHAAATLAVMDWRQGQPSCSFSHDTLGWM